MIHGKDMMNALMPLTMVFFLNVIKTTGDCPRYCECKWKSGKESVLCLNANMTEIPKHLDSGTQLLDLTGNKLQTIGPDEFFNASLLNLQKIFLSKCRLRFIDRSSFRKIINLVELDLSYNELHSVPSHTFEFITELRELRLNGNPIIRVLNNAFKMVPRLTKLDLSECRIGYVEIKAFQGLESSLEWLKLDKNKIINIKSFALVNLANLHGLELSGNPWNCSCGLRTLREWMLKQNVPYSIPPICKYPSRLLDKIWDKLDLDEFACAPRIEAATPAKNGQEGTNVTLSCSIQGIPEPDVRWLKKNHVIANLTNPPNGGKPKAYIVHVAKASSNLTIVTADLHDNGVYVCRAENKAGKSEANITLTVSVKPLIKIWSSKMIAAVGMVSLLFATAVGLLTFCAWSSRKRKFDFRHSVSAREYEADGYEMNHKKPISYDKILDYGNHYGADNASNAYGVPGSNSRSDGYSERSTEMTRDGKNQSKELAMTETSGSGSRNGGGRDSPKTSNVVGDRLNKSANSRLSPDLHIPRLNDDGTSNQSPGDGKGGNYLSDSLASSANFHDSNPKVSPRSAGPNKTDGGRGFHFPGESQRSGPTREKFPDLLELSRNTENLINNNSFCTMPRKRIYKIKRSRDGSYGSESQSPLLAGSSNDSCDSNFSSSRRPSIESGCPSKNTSLPTSPGHFHQKPILDLTDGSPEIFAKSPTTLKYKSWELEKFLKEYRILQDQLYKMKESCENLKEDNLKFRGNCDSFDVDIPAATTTTTTTTTMTTTIPKVVSPSHSAATPAEALYGVNKNFLDDSNIIHSLYPNGGLIEDNNNPKFVLKNKQQSNHSELVSGESYWPPTRKILKTFTEPNSGNPFYQS